MGKREGINTLEIFQSDEFIIMGECAIHLLVAKLEAINAEYSFQLGRKIMNHLTSRIKSVDSVRTKLVRKECPLTAEEAMDKLNDLVGVRVVCAFVDDLYCIKEALEGNLDLKILRIKDYVKMPKNSGYRSLHMIIEVPVYMRGELVPVKVELQLRTSAMDFWAGVDHQLRYKKGRKEAELIGEELKEYAGVIRDVDNKLVELRDKIAAI